MARLQNLSKATLSHGFDAITIEGALISPPMLARIALQEDNAATRAAYRIPKGLTLRDETARAFRIGQALFEEFAKANAPSASATMRFVETLLRDVFGFSDVIPVASRSIGERIFPVTLEALGGRVPVIVVPPTDALDRPSASLSSGRRRSAASALQDWLNANDAALWGLVSNGISLRLMRDNPALTRPAYIEADLARIFTTEAFADFSALFLLCHISRFGSVGASPFDCALEHARDEGASEGLAARDRLSIGVKDALRVLGTGFLSDPANASLRDRLHRREILLPDFFTQLLRLVYRMIFLLTAEDRYLLHPQGVSTGIRALYAEGYSLSRLRDRAIRRSTWDHHADLWEGLRILFSALGHGEPRLGLPALDGIYAPGTLPDLEPLRLSNRALMEAIYRLAWLKEKSGLVRVNWRDMQTEELGSVYESLLELAPLLSNDGRELVFAEGAEQKGNARKTSGSYYTPDALVQTLLDSALDPVLERVAAEAADPAAALLGISVIDPACGSGHFLLAAGRRIATRLARARAGGVASTEDYRHALRDVARTCLYGVDRNPMAVELAKVALWIETVDPGKPLGFLDANLRCGDALLGVFDLAVLDKGIPAEAYKPLTGDDKETAKFFEKRNRAALQGQGTLNLFGAPHLPPAPMAAEIARLRALPENTPEEIAAKRHAFEANFSGPASWALRVAADLYMAAFLLPKPKGTDIACIPDTAHVRLAASGRQAPPQLVGISQAAASDARAFHWPLEFPDIFARGGFDVVLGNPPWERIKLQEQEFFAQREPEIATAPNAAARGKLIAALAKAEPGTRQHALHVEFEATKRLAEATSLFVRSSGRFALTGAGDVNTYALFAEHFASSTSPRGRAGVIVPTGIATDATTAPFFASLSEGQRLVRLVDFENRDRIFPAIDSRIKFSLLTIGRDAANAEFAFFLTSPAQLTEPERRFTLSPAQIAQINPNTKTAPVFRARTDAALTAKIYDRVPILINEAAGRAGNPWGISFMAMFHMSNDSGLFRTAAQLREHGFLRDGTNWRRQADEYVPLYEAKLIHQFDHRWATYNGPDSRDVTEAEKQDQHFEPTPRYWVPAAELGTRLHDKNWQRGWLMGWRDICRSTDERTVIATAFPKVGVGHTAPLFFVDAAPTLWAALLANLSSLTLDDVARQKVGGTHLTYGYFMQFPIFPPNAYSGVDIAFIVPRVLELTYTSRAMAPFALDLGYEGAPFAWDEPRRAQLRAELDAFYARKYGLTRDELRYILDPEDAMGAGYPSETFRVLKNNETRRYGEYRTARLVLAAWDAMAQVDVSQSPSGSHFIGAVGQ